MRKIFWIKLGANYIGEPNGTKQLWFQVVSGTGNGTENRVIWFVEGENLAAYQPSFRLQNISKPSL